MNFKERLTSKIKTFSVNRKEEKNREKARERNLPKKNPDDCSLCKNFAPFEQKEDSKMSLKVFSFQYSRLSCKVCDKWASNPSWFVFKICFQAAHQEIKSHGQTIKSIVSICEQFSSRSQQKRASNQDVGRSIERRWHCLWLRSLEWQCYLEQQTWTPTLIKKNVSVNKSFF